MKTSIGSLGVGLAMAVLPFSGVADDVEDDLVFLHYQNFVQSQETGVYEDNDLLYVQVKVPFDCRKDNPAKKKAEVVLAAYDLLKKWAADYSAPERNKVDDATEGVRFAKNIALGYLPEWQFREWSPKLNMREFPHKTDEGFYVLGQSVAKAEVIRNIPDSFFKPFAQKDWEDALVAAVKRGVAKDGREKVVAECGAWDALVKPTEADGDALLVREEIASYLAESQFAAKMREAQEMINGPMEVVAWSDVDVTQEAVTNTSVSAVTNALDTSVVKGLPSVREQTSAEIAECGRSMDSKIEAVTETKDEQEVVETITRTIVETRRFVRRKSLTRGKGTARFEELFLEGGVRGEKSAATTALGEKAAKTYFDSTTVDVKEVRIKDALRENPGDANLWNLYGKCLAAKGEKSGAAICFKIALRINPDAEYPLVNLAEIYQEQGKRKLAIGLATYARAIAKEKWCVEHATAILTK